jgi:tripartite-type tricarboxylate transporter receptor subunit TctC
MEKEGDPMTRLLLVISALVAACCAAAQERYPEKPIHVLVGFPAGSTADVAARLIGQKWSEAMAKPVVIENLAGAAGNIAMERVVKAAPDGYTLALAVNAQLTVNPGLYKLSYDPAKDLAPISQVYAATNVLVVPPTAPVASFGELIALARTQPGELTFASGGGGSSPHIAAELLKSAARLDIRHVPYKGVVAGVPDLLAGRVTMMFAPSTVALPPVRAGKLRALVVTSLKRSPALPDVPTVAESGFPGFEATIWGGLVAPAATQAAVIRKLHMETVNALKLADVQARLAEGGLEPIGSSPAEFAQVIRSEIPKWAKLIAESGMRPD